MRIISILAAAIALAIPARAPAQAAQTAVTPQVRDSLGHYTPSNAGLAIDTSGVALVQSAQSISGTISAAGTDGKSIVLRGPFNFTLVGTGVMQVAIERSFDKGVTWAQAHRVGAGVALFCVADGQGDCADPGSLTRTFYEPEAGVLYRVNITSYTSGSLAYGLSQ